MQSFGSLTSQSERAHDERYRRIFGQLVKHGYVENLQELSLWRVFLVDVVVTL